MKWTDSLEIAIALADAHPDVDPRRVRFADLRDWVLALPGFDDDPDAQRREDPRGDPDGVDRRGVVVRGRLGSDPGAVGSFGVRPCCCWV